MKKFYTIKLSTKQSFLDGYKKKTTPTRPLNDLLEEGFLDEHVYYDGCSTRSGSDFEKILIVITSPVTSFAVTLSAPPDTRRHSMLTVPFDAEDVEILGPNFMRLRDGSIFTADEHGYSWVSWSVELSAEERTARNSKVTAMTSADIAKASADIAKASEQLIANRIENTDLKNQVKKAEAVSCATLKEALSSWASFAGEVNPKIAMAVQMYMNPETRKFSTVAKKMNVSPSTLTGWFNKFEKETGFSLGRPKPRENFSVRAQTEITHTSGNRRNRTQMTESEFDDNGDVFTEHG